MSKVNVKDLLKADVHFGHFARKWCSYMAPYIYMKKNGIHLIDLYKTLLKLQEAGKEIQNIVASKKKILFVATKKQAKEIVIEYSKKNHMPYLTARWIGGLLTNFVNIRKAILKKHYIVKKQKSVEYSFFSKKDRLLIDRLEKKFNRNLESLLEMTSLPAAVFIVDLLREKIVLKEAKKLKIPIFAIVDTNYDPRKVDYIIPANDDSSKSIGVIFKYISKSIEAGFAKIENENKIK